MKMVRRPFHTESRLMIVCFARMLVMVAIVFVTMAGGCSMGMRYVPIDMRVPHGRRAIAHEQQSTRQKQTNEPMVGTKIHFAICESEIPISKVTPPPTENNLDESRTSSHRPVSTHNRHRFTEERRSIFIYKK